MIVIAMLAAGSGLWSAWLWLEASRIEIKPSQPTSASISDAPELHIMDAQVELNNLIEASKRSSHLNKRAALWTAASALLGALSSMWHSG